MISILVKFAIADNLTTVDFFWISALIIQKTSSAIQIRAQTRTGTYIEAWLSNTALSAHCDYLFLAPWAIDENIDSLIQQCARRSL